MSASEFAFLALGLVLGVASGAALIEVLRARPPVSRAVRVTVAPNAIQSRLASTLAEPHVVGEPAGPARGGPADRRASDEAVATGEPAATGRRSGRAPGGRSNRQVASTPGGMPSTGTPVHSAASEVPDGDHVRAFASPAGALGTDSGQSDRPAPLWLAPLAGGTRPALVAVPMSLEPDPITAALRATAAASAVAAMAGSAETGRRSAGGAAVAASIDDMVRSGSTTGRGTVVSTVAPTNGETAAATAAGGGRHGNAPSGANPDRSRLSGADSAPDAESTPRPDGPCAEERRVADERCAVATRAREGAAAAADALRRAQRTYDELVAGADAAAVSADPRAVRTAKEQAQQRFRDARTTARTRDDVEAGARAWLAEINAINHDVREALLGIERDRSAAAALGPSVERLTVEADAARISAERAAEACVAAREAVAGCDEARALEEAALRSATADPRGSEPAARIAAAMPEPEDEFAFSSPLASAASHDAVILRILRGDREAMQQAVAELAGDDRDARHRWQLQLGNLAEALIARSIEASSFDFPTSHSFWGPFSQAQNRDIAAGLSSLGFRFDGFGDWVDERAPSQRDLALAVGYAGLDPMRVRRWPTEAETRELLRDVRVAADEYIAGAAGGLSLGELVTLLGRRADGLTELWNEWGRVRPILLGAN